MDPRGETTAMEQEYKITVRPATLGDASFMAHTFVESLKGSPWWNYYYRPAKGELTPEVDRKLVQEVIALRKHAFLQSLCNSNTHTTIALLDNEPAGFSTWTNPLQRPNLSRSLTFLERVVSKYYICRNWILSKLPRRFYNWLFISKLGEEYRLKWSTAGRKNSELFKDIIPFTVRNEGYWFLNHLFIKPEYQRKRIGFILLKDGLEKKIDRSELKAYTAASVEGRNLYAKVGFESVRVTEEGDEKSGTVISDIMCYTPGRDRGSDKK